MAKWILAGVFAVIGLPMVWIALRVFDRDRTHARWPRAPGVVTSSQLEASTQKYRDDNGYYYDRTVYKTVVRYTYTVGGQTLAGTRIARAVDDVAMDREAAQGYVDKYPAGKEILVFHDPADPRSAYLEIKRSTGGVVLLVFGCVWLALAALFLVLALVSWSRTGRA